MKILLVITKAEIGGGQYFVLSLASALKEHGYDISVAAGEGDFLKIELDEIGVPFYRLTSLKREISFRSTLNYFAELTKIIKENKFSIVHFNASNTLIGVLPLWLIIRRPKIVFTVHGLSIMDDGSNTSRPLKIAFSFYFKFLLPFVDKCIFVSAINRREAFRKKMVQSGDVIVNGFFKHPESFESKETSRKYLYNNYSIDCSGSFIIGSIGRLAYPKNYEFLIENFHAILKVVSSAKLFIIGDGPLEKKYSETIERLHLKEKIILLGAIPHASRYIKAFDLFVLPSHFEGLSISLLEALFANVPILAADVGGNKEILGEHSEFLYQSDNLQEFLSRLEKISKGEVKFEEYFEAQQLKFAGKTMVDKYLDVYKSLSK